MLLVDFLIWLTVVFSVAFGYMWGRDAGKDAGKRELGQALRDRGVIKCACRRCLP